MLSEKKRAQGPKVEVRRWGDGYLLRYNRGSMYDVLTYEDLVSLGEQISVERGLDYVSQCELGR